MKLEEQSTPALSAGPVLGEHFQPHGIKEDRAGGMADTVPCSSSLPHSPAPAWGCFCLLLPQQIFCRHNGAGSGAGSMPGRSRAGAATPFV